MKFISEIKIHVTDKYVFFVIVYFCRFKMVATVLFIIILCFSSKELQKEKKSVHVLCHQNPRNCAGSSFFYFFNSRPKFHN